MRQSTVSMHCSSTGVFNRGNGSGGYGGGGERTVGERKDGGSGGGRREGRGGSGEVGVERERVG